MADLWGDEWPATALSNWSWDDHIMMLQTAITERQNWIDSYGPSSAPGGGWQAITASAKDKVNAAHVNDMRDAVIELMPYFYRLADHGNYAAVSDLRTDAGLPLSGGADIWLRIPARLPGSGGANVFGDVVQDDCMCYEWLNELKKCLEQLFMVWYTPSYTGASTDSQKIGPWSAVSWDDAWTQMKAAADIGGSAIGAVDHVSADATGEWRDNGGDEWRAWWNLYNIDGQLTSMPDADEFDFWYLYMDTPANGTFVQGYDIDNTESTPEEIKSVTAEIATPTLYQIDKSLWMDGGTMNFNFVMDSTDPDDYKPAAPSDGDTPKKKGFYMDDFRVLMVPMYDYTNLTVMAGR
jgi:hypothetical protein